MSDLTRASLTARIDQMSAVVRAESPLSTTEIACLAVATGFQYAAEVLRLSQDADKTARLGMADQFDSLTETTLQIGEKQ